MILYHEENHEAEEIKEDQRETNQENHEPLMLVAEARRDLNPHLDQESLILEKVNRQDRILTNLNLMTFSVIGKLPAPPAGVSKCLNEVTEVRELPTS